MWLRIFRHFIKTLIEFLINLRSVGKNKYKLSSVYFHYYKMPFTVSTFYKMLYNCSFSISKYNIFKSLCLSKIYRFTVRYHFTIVVFVKLNWLDIGYYKVTSCLYYPSVNLGHLFYDLLCAITLNLFNLNIHFYFSCSSSFIKIKFVICFSVLFISNTVPQL